MSFYSKIKTIAETMTGYNVIVDNNNGANIDFDSLTFPCILIAIQQKGKYNTKNSHYRDSAKVLISLLNKTTQDAIDSELDPIKETLKTDLIELYNKIRFNFDFEINSDSIDYSVNYDTNNANLLEVAVEDTLTERVGFNLACNTVPQPQSILVIVKDQDGNTLGTYTQNGTYTITIQSTEMIGRFIDTEFLGNTIILPHTPIALTEELHIDGVLQTVGDHYAITGNVIVLVNPITETSIINCPYRYL